MYLLRALKALGLFNLNSYSNTDSIGVSGSIMVDNTTIVGRKVIFLRIFNKLHISRFVAGDLDYHS